MEYWFDSNAIENEVIPNLEKFTTEGDFKEIVDFEKKIADKFEKERLKGYGQGSSFQTKLSKIETAIGNIETRLKDYKTDIDLLEKNYMNKLLDHVGSTIKDNLEKRNISNNSNSSQIEDAYSDLKVGSATFDKKEVSDAAYFGALRGGATPSEDVTDISTGEVN